jgi:hypothetical protein
MIDSLDFNIVFGAIGAIFTIVGSIWGAYLGLRDKISNINSDQMVTQAILETVRQDLKDLKRDIDNIALIIGTDRAIAEQLKKGE